jgi:hypothetical protein
VRDIGEAPRQAGARFPERVARRHGRCPAVNGLRRISGDVTLARLMQASRGSHRTSDLMHEPVCPRCGSHEVVERVVNDCFKACDSAGNVFEVTVREPVLRCCACRMCWEGDESLLAKENAYRAALARREVETRTR